MQRNDELRAAGLPPDFFKEERERRQAQQEHEESVMAAKRAVERASMGGRIRQRPVTDFTWRGGRASRRSVGRGKAA